MRGLNLPFVQRLASFTLPALLGIGVLGLTRNVAAQERTIEDKAPVIEIGPAAERDLKQKTSAYGVSIAIEKTAIEEWLELEVGVAYLTNAGRNQLGVGLLFKKPFDLSPRTELMVGIGPTLTRKLNGDERGTSLGLQVALDLMFWATEAKVVGWYFEPTYAIGLGNSKGERSLGGSAGLLIRWK